MYKIGDLTKKFNISRTTLLYYDDIDLLNPSSRSKTNYRLYSDEDLKRLELICVYKEMGVELKDIKILLDKKNIDNKIVLEKVLIKLDNDIKDIKNKQKKILKILRTPNTTNSSKMNVFSYIIENLCIEKKEFHAMFEKKDTKTHKEFLEFLELSDDDIKRILSKLL